MKLSYLCLIWLILFTSIGNGLQCVGQALPIDQIKAGEIVDKKYAGFGLGEWEEGDDDAYYVRFYSPFGDGHIVVFYNTLDCTPIICKDLLELFLINQDTITYRLSTELLRELNPEFEILHNTFLQCIEVRHEWYEDGNGMTYNEADNYVGGLRFILKDNKLIPLENLSKSDLRIYRNLIFAKYGYRFKSENLNDYFSSKDWYVPIPGLDINKVLTEKDIEMINFIRELEGFTGN